MGLFDRAKPEAKPPRESLGLLDLQERMEKLERRLRDIETDWASQYDKFHRLNMRLAKRQKSIEEAETQPDLPREDAPGDTNGGQRTANPLAAALLSRGSLR